MSIQQDSLQPSHCCRLYNGVVSRTVESLLREAWDAMDGEDYAAAESLGRRALLSNGRSVEARMVIAQALMNKEDYEAASSFLKEAVDLAPDDPQPRVELGIALFQSTDFRSAEEYLENALRLDPDLADAFYWLALCHERSGNTAEAERNFLRARDLDPEEFSLPLRLTPEEFQRSLQEATDQLPDEFRAALENLVIEVQDVPSLALLREEDPPLDPSLLGLFEGVPRPHQSLMDAPRLPERILIFQRNLERQCANREELVEEIVVTLRHEIGHYLGLEEQELERCGYD